MKRKAISKRKTIAFSTLKRLSILNSRKLPQLVVVGGSVRRWVGFGWVDEQRKPAPGEKVVYVVEDEKG
jgi:hypothetical protein